MLTLKKLVLNCSCIFVHFTITVNYVNLSFSVRLRTAIQVIFNKSKSILAFGRAKIAKIACRFLLVSTNRTWKSFNRYENIHNYLKYGFVVEKS